MQTTPLASHPEDTPAPVRRSSLALIVVLVIGFAAGLAVGYLSWGTQDTQAIQANVPAITPTPARVDVPIGSAPTLGPANAPVTIIEFSDYQCPYCKKWTSEVWPQIQKAYPTQVRLVYKDFPLTQLHSEASPAAAAARCANDQGKYWQFHDQLFASNSLSQQVYDSIATQLNLDVAQWKACISAKKYDNDIVADYSYGQQLGITGTPTFFINGLALVGAQPFSVFKQAIDQELAKK